MPAATSEEYVTVESPQEGSARTRIPGAMAHSDPHAGHEHFNCSCGKVFHSRQELADHARRLNHRAA